MSPTQSPAVWLKSLARPGGNITGFTAYESSIGEKWLEVLKEIAPRLTQVAVLVDPQNPTWMMHVPTMEKAAPLFAVQLTAAHVRDAAEIERSINSFGARPNTGLIVLPSVMNSDQRELITTLAAKHRMPAILMRSVPSSRAADLPTTAPIGSTSTGALRHTSIVSSRALSPRTCRSSNRRSSKAGHQPQDCQGAGH